MDRLHSGMGIKPAPVLLMGMFTQGREQAATHRHMESAARRPEAMARARPRRAKAGSRYA